MFKGLYEKLPNLSAYLDRLKMAEAPNPDLEGLNQLIYAHQCMIPFENLDICERQIPISLNIGDIFDKVIMRKRGGYCFELNALFHSLLETCGFQVIPCTARIVRGKDYVALPLHRANLVALDKTLYFCDVGYGGPQPAQGVPVDDEWEGTLRGHTYRITQQRDNWWLLSQRLQEELVPTISFSAAPMDPVDFIPANYYASTSPDSIFTRYRFLNRRTPEGSVSILDNIFSKVSHHHKTEQKITSDQDFQEILDTYFSLSF